MHIPHFFWKSDAADGVLCFPLQRAGIWKGQLAHVCSASGSIRGSPRKHVYPRNMIYISLCGHRVWSVHFVHPHECTGRRNKKWERGSALLRWSEAKTRKQWNTLQDRAMGWWGQGQLCHSPAAEDMICEYVGQITSEIVTIPVPPHNWVPEGKVPVPWLGLPTALNLERTNLRLDTFSLLHPTDVRSDSQCKQFSNSGFNWAWG